ncbi:MAG: BsuBI/PstI family type II restriction endonuclease [Victivallales bacterium]
MTFIKNNYGRDYAPNTRETFRRQVLHQFVQGRIVDYNPDEPDLPTNSPPAHYAVSTAALNVICSFGLPDYQAKVDIFSKSQGSLAEIYLKSREIQAVPVILPSGKEFKLSPGKHNELQAAIIKNFASRFLKSPKVLYFGDTAKKGLVIDYPSFEKLNVNVSDHDKLPDIVLFDSSRNWLFLIEAVTSHGPMNPKRVFELQTMFRASECEIVFVSAFPDFAEFKRHTNDISWETEVWISDFPEHMIHFNGDKFLGPTKKVI